MSSQTLKLVVALAAVYVIWGSTYLAIRFAIETLPGFLMAGIRFVVAGSLIYGWQRVRGKAKPHPTHWLTALLIGFFLLVGGNGGVVFAEYRVASGLVALLIATEPLWVVLVDWLRPHGRRPHGLEVLGLLVGFSGAAWLMAPAAQGGGIDLLGAAVVLGAALSWAVGSVCSRELDTPRDPFQATAMTMIMGGILLVTLGFITGEGHAVNFDAFSFKSVAALIYLIVFGAMIGFSAYVWLLRNTTLARASTYAYVNPVVAVLLGWLLAGESITLRIVISSGIILAGVAMISRAAVASPAPVTEELRTVSRGDR